ncbi:MAG: hypothetical protein N2445_06050 [Acidobacteria bacterium]|nr:hypothetical protein [Acidobacteriota bacterium]
MAEEAAEFINAMNPTGKLKAEDVEYFGWFGSPSLDGWRGLISPWPHSVVEIKLNGRSVKTYDPFWGLFLENILSR